MEKQRNFSKSKSFRRLLIFVLFSCLTAGISAKTLTASQIKKLRIAPAANQKMYAKTELKFEVVLPDTPAQTVQVQAPEETNGVTFKTLRKTELYSSSTDTKIELWFTFDKTGTYQLYPLIAVIGGYTRSIQFDEVVIEDNPANVQPRLVIKFDNGQTVYSDSDISKKVLFDAVTGNKISYTLYLQHAVQLIQFNWELPKDSIFNQTKNYEITEIKYREKNYSDELIPVAGFEWIPLAEGKQPMPVIRILATGYNGYRTTINVPDFYINFINSGLKETSDDDDLFAAAFNSDYVQSAKVNQIKISDQDCEKLAQLHTKEKRAFFNFSKAKQQRKAFEQSLNLPVSPAEYPLFLLYISIFILLVLIVLFIILLKTKKSLQKILILTGIICTLVVVVSSFVKVSKKYAIVKQAQLLSVPDQTAGSINELSAGTKVRILEETGEWSYIEIGEIGGWVKNDRLCKI